MESETKYAILAITSLAINILVACTIPPTTPTQTSASDIATVAIPTITPAQTPSGNAAEEAGIRDLVENFGKRLQDVALQSPDAAQEIQMQYSEFVSPALLKMWVNDVSKAPGRMVSSPRADRIEITVLSKEGSDRYEITGFVVEVTSTEVVGGGAAARIPVHIVVQRGQGGWLISEYAEEQ